MIRTRLLALALAATTTLAACGSDDPTGPGGGGGGSKSMQASVEGQQWTANPLAITAVWNQEAEVLTFAGNSLQSGTNTQINITLVGVDGPGTYQLGPAFTGTQALLTITQGTTPSSWTTVLSPATGSVTVATLTGTRVAGTFSFTGQAAPGTAATGQRTVSSGQFDITF